MFERNRVDNSDQGLISVEVVLTDGTGLTGKISMPAGRNFGEFLNGASTFFEFEGFDGERSYVAKSSVRAIRAIAGPRAVGLTQRLRDLDGFDPHTILGLDRSATWEETRGSFHKLAKVYHPDRYATAELPDEVRTYLSAMARRINAAYAALESAHAQRRQFAALKQEPIFTSRPRA